MQAYGHWLAWLAGQNLLHRDRAAGDRVTKLLFAHFVDQLKGRVSSASVAAFVGGLKGALGHKVNPHLFRDCVATSIAIHDPEHVRTATAILGHTHVSTTNRYYNQAQMINAAREHNRAVLRLRKKARSWRPRRSEER